MAHLQFKDLPLPGKTGMIGSRVVILAIAAVERVYADTTSDVGGVLHFFALILIMIAIGGVPATVDEKIFKHYEKR